MLSGSIPSDMGPLQLLIREERDATAFITMMVGPSRVIKSWQYQEVRGQKGDTGRKGSGKGYGRRERKGPTDCKSVIKKLFAVVD